MLRGQLPARPQRANVHAPGAIPCEWHFCSADAIGEDHAGFARVGYANSEAPIAETPLTLAHGSPRSPELCSPGNRQNAAQATDSAAESWRHTDWFSNGL